MGYKVYAPMLLVLAISLVGFQALATHKTNETYDGTIKSFRWLKSSITVAEVLIQNEQQESIELARFNGKIVLLNLWATWCPPCVKELPALDRLQRRLGGDDFIIVAVSLDEDLNLARQMFSDLSIQSMVLYSQSAENLGRHVPVDVLPTTFIIDRDGRAMGLLRSSINWDDPELDNLISRLIAGVTSTTLRAEKQAR